MKSTRREILARHDQLVDQLLATGHESRKKRAARLQDMTLQIAKLNEQLQALHREHEGVKDKLAVAEDTIDTLRAAEKAKKASDAEALPATAV